MQYTMLRRKGANRVRTIVVMLLFVDVDVVRSSRPRVRGATCTCPVRV